MSVESRRESRKRVRQGDIPEIDISVEANDLVTALSRASTIAKEVADDSFGEFSDLSRKFARFTSITSVGQAVLDILETGDTESVLWESIGSHVVGAAAGGAMGLRFRNPYFIGLVTIGGGVAGAEGVQAAIDWLRKSDVEKLEDIESVIEWIKKPKGYQDDPNFSPPEELDKGGAPAAMGSSRAPGQRGSINPVDAHNALDGLTAENALYDGSLFRTAIEADRARLQREQAPHASGESQQDSTGRRSRGPYDLDGPEAAAQEAPAAEVKAGSNITSDAQETETPLQQGARHYVEIGAEEGLELGANLSAEGDGADQHLSYYDTQYGPHGNRARAYIHFMEEKERAQQAEENQRRAAERAERARRNIPREVPINGTSQVGGVSRSPAWKEGIVAPYEAFERPNFPYQDHLKPAPMPDYSDGDQLKPVPMPQYPEKDPGDPKPAPMPRLPIQDEGETRPSRTWPPSAQPPSVQPSSTWPPPYIDNFILGGPSFGLDARGLSLIGRILQQYGRPPKAAGPFPSANEFLKGPPIRTQPIRSISAETDEDDFETGSYGGPAMAYLVGAQLMNEK